MGRSSTAMLASPEPVILSLRHFLDAPDVMLQHAVSFQVGELPG